MPFALFAVFPVVTPISFTDIEAAECLRSAWEAYRVYVENKIQDSSENRKRYWLKILYLIDNPEGFPDERKNIEQKSNAWRRLYTAEIDKAYANKKFVINWFREGWHPDSDSGELEQVINKTVPFIFLKKEILGKIRKCLILFLIVLFIFCTFYFSSVNSDFSNFDIFNSSSLLSYFPFNKGIRRAETIEKIVEKEKLFPISEEKDINSSFEDAAIPSSSTSNLASLLVRKGKGKGREVDILSRIEEGISEREDIDEIEEANIDIPNLRNKEDIEAIHAIRDKVVEDSLKNFNLNSEEVINLSKSYQGFPETYVSNTSTSDYGSIISSNPIKNKNKPFNLEICPNRNKPLPPLPEEAFLEDGKSDVVTENVKSDFSRDTIDSLMARLGNPTANNTINSIFEDNSLNESVIKDIEDFADEVFYEGKIDKLFLVFLLKNSKIKILKFIIKNLFKIIVRIIIIQIIKTIFLPIGKNILNFIINITFCDTSIISMSIAEYEEWLKEFYPEKITASNEEKHLPKLPSDEKDLPNIPSEEKDLPNLPSEEKVLTSEEDTKEDSKNLKSIISKYIINIWK